MLIFDFVGEVLGDILGGAIFDGIKGLFTRSFKGKKKSKTHSKLAYPTKYHSNHPYYTIRKQSIKFTTAQKRVLVWETEINRIEELVKHKAATNHDRTVYASLKLRSVNGKTIIVPPSHISSEAFHRLILILYIAGIKAVGLVETTKAAYTVHGDPASGCLIGQTNKGESFFILSSDDYDDKQYLRISKNIVVLEGFDVRSVKSEF